MTADEPGEQSRLGARERDGVALGTDSPMPDGVGGIEDRGGAAVAPGDERRDLVEQIDDDLRRELVDGRARPEVDRMHPVLPDAHPRHLGAGGLTAEGSADLAVPRLRGHGCCRGQQSRRPRRRLGA